jgi:competence protein ComEC
LGFLRFSVATNYPEHHINSLLQYREEFVQTLYGQIIDYDHSGERLSRYTVSVDSIAGYPTEGRVYLYTTNRDLNCNDLIKTIASFQRPRPPSNPGMIDYADMLEQAGIHATAFAQVPVEVVGHQRHLLREYIVSIREMIRTRIHERFQEHSGLICAILIGDRSGLEDWDYLITRAGLNHLIAISGLHVGIIAFITFIILKIFIRNRFLNRIILIIILLTYAGVCSWRPSVSRAVIMISVYLIAQLSNRLVSANNVLALAFIIITAFNPFLLFTIGFQLSFIAVFVLLNLLPQVRIVKIDKEEIALLSASKKMLNSVLAILISSALITTFLSPLLMFYFYQFNFNGIFGNIIGIPLVSIMIPLNFLLLVLPELPILVAIYQNSALLLVYIFKNWSQFVSQLPFYHGFVSISWWQVLLIYALLLSLFSLIFCKLKKRTKLFIAITVAIIVIILIFSIANVQRDRLKIVFFDAGLGDLFLIRTPDNENVMIDAGPSDFASNHFSYSALPYFKQHGISTIDWLILTHAHNDHYGGFEALIQEVIVENLLIHEHFFDRPVWETFEPLIEEYEVDLTVVSDTMQIALSSVNLKVIHPDKDYSHSNINNLSIVTRLEYQNFSALFTGDIESEAENYLTSNYEEYLPCYMLKIAHHGSKSSSTEQFLDYAKPEYAFIPTSLENRFNFPHEETLQNLAFLEDRLFIAEKDGAVILLTDGEKVHISTYLSQKEYIEIIE